MPGHDDHWFTRMCDVRDLLAEEREQLFRALAMFLREEFEKHGEKGDTLNIDNLVAFLSGLATRMKSLEKQNQQLKEKIKSLGRI